jgi:hypothetical protein
MSPEQGIIFRISAQTRWMFASFLDGSFLGGTARPGRHRKDDTHQLFAREIFIRFLNAANLLKGLVARDGIEPPTPAFSGPRSTN